MKKYIVRALKYFVYLCIVLFIIISILVAFNLVEKDIDAMFVNGWDSLWQIALIVLAFAAVYPRFGYGQRELNILGDPSEAEGIIKAYMEEHGYKLVARTPESLSFRKTNSLIRAIKMYEDTIVFSRELSGYILEGRTKDIVRCESGIRSRIQPVDE